jgi:hypothetical protein
MTDWSNPETFWLNVTNAALGVVVLLALGGIVAAALSDVFARIRARAAARESVEAHAFLVPGLGMTMADGGERKTDDEEKKDSKGEAR